MVSGKLRGLKVMELSPSFWGRGSASQVSYQRTLSFHGPPESSSCPQQCTMQNMKHNSHSENHILDSFFQVLSPGGFHELWWSNLSWQHPGIPWFSGLSLLPLKNTHCTFKPDSECILQPVSVLSSNSESHNATILSSPHLITITSSVS